MASTTLLPNTDTTNMTSSLSSLSSSLSSSPSSSLSSTSNFTWSDGEMFTWHGAEILFIPLMMMLGIVGNLVVFYIYHFRWRSDTVTLVKRMLAILDLAFLILAMPIVLHLSIYPRSPIFVPICRFSSFVALVSAVASGFVLLIIAVDRFLKLCLLQKRGVSSKNSKKFFAIGLIISTVLNLPVCWVFGIDVIDFHHYNVRSFYCFIADEKNETLFLVWAVALSICFTSITTTLVVIYTKIIRTLQELSKKHDELKRRPSLAAGNDLLQKQKQSEVMRATAIVFIVITIVFFCSYFPYFITLLLSMTDPTVEGSMGPKLKAIYDLCKLSPLVNNIANPFVYSFSSQRFRQELKKIVTLKCLQKGAFRRRAYSTTNDKSLECEISVASMSKDYVK